MKIKELSKQEFMMFVGKLIPLNIHKHKELSIKNVVNSEYELTDSEHGTYTGRAVLTTQDIIENQLYSYMHAGAFNIFFVENEKYYQVILLKYDLSYKTNFEIFMTLYNIKYENFYPNYIKLNSFFKAFMLESL